MGVGRPLCPAEMPQNHFIAGQLQVTVEKNQHHPDQGVEPVDAHRAQGQQLPQRIKAADMDVFMDKDIANQLLIVQIHPLREDDARPQDADGGRGAYLVRADDCQRPEQPVLLPPFRDNGVVFHGNGGSECPVILCQQGGKYHNKHHCANHPQGSQRRNRQGGFRQCRNLGLTAPDCHIAASGNRRVLMSPKSGKQVVNAPPRREGKGNQQPCDDNSPQCQKAGFRQPVQRDGADDHDGRNQHPRLHAHLNNIHRPPHFSFSTIRRRPSISSLDNFFPLI